MSLVVERERGLVWVKLNRPERRNAVDEATVSALISELDREPGATVLLGSAVPGIFCAGADLTISDAERARCSDLLYECYEHLITRPGPVIAVVEGPAVGGGAQLATAADLRIAGPQARLRWVGPGHGLAVGAWVLPALVGRGTALELTLTGRWVDATEAMALRLVTAVERQPWRAAEKLADSLAALDPAAVAKIKTITAEPGLRERLAAERDRNRAEWSGAVR